MAKILKGDEFKKKLNLHERLESEIPTAFSAGSDLGGVVDRQLLDAGTQGRHIIDEAKEDGNRIKAEAREILAQVQVEMEKSKKEGYDLGYQEGLQQAMELLVRVKDLRERLFTENEREMVRLVFEIAEKIIGREFRENDKAIMNVIRLAINDAVGEKIYIRVNPQDNEKIKKSEAELLTKADAGKTLIFREDDTVKPGGCIVETEIGTIDAQLETQLSAIKKALGL